MYELKINMETTPEKDKVAYGPYSTYSRYAQSKSHVHSYMEDSDVRCSRWMNGLSDGLKLSEYASILDSTRGHDILFRPLRGDIKNVYHPVVSRGGVSLSILAHSKKSIKIKTLLEAGAVPDQYYTNFRWGNDSEEWDYLSKLYTEYQGRKKAKPACVKREEEEEVRESITS